MYVPGPAFWKRRPSWRRPARPGERDAASGLDHQSADLIRRMIRKFTSEMTAMSMNSAHPIADA